MASHHKPNAWNSPKGYNQVAEKSSKKQVDNFSNSNTNDGSPIDNNDSDWIKVTKKKKEKGTTESVAPVEESHRIGKPSKEDTLARRAKLKMEKKLKREQKIKLEREQKLKNTKLNFITQEDINSRQSSKSVKTSFENNKQVQSPNDKNILEEEWFPALSSELVVKPQSNKESVFPSVQQNSVSVKKKVKTKDLVQFDLESLIKVKKLPKNDISTKVPTRKPKKVELKKPTKKGKEREVPKQILTTVRKKINQEKAANQQEFATFLSQLKSKSEEHKAEEEDCSFAEVKPAETSDHQSDIISSSENETKIPETSDSKLAETSDLESALSLQNEPSLSEENEIDQLQSVKIGLITDLQWLNHPIHNNHFREYCNHMVTKEVIEAATEFIGFIVKFQVRLYEKDPIKGRSRRRYYCGMRECKRHMKKFVCLFVAPNLKKYKIIDEQLLKLLEAAMEYEVPVIYALNHRKLASLCLQKGSVSCMGIVNNQGAQESYKKLLEQVALAKAEYDKITTSSTVNPMGKTMELMRENDKNEPQLSEQLNNLSIDS